MVTTVKIAGISHARVFKDGITFDDVLIVPGYSDIDTRASISLAQDFLGYNTTIPIISANMDYVTEGLMANAMLDAGGVYILHRFLPLNDLMHEINEIGYHEKFSDPAPIIVSVGAKNPDESYNHVEKLHRAYARPIIVCIDVAHGHYQKVIDLIKKFKGEGYKIIAGNVATAYGYQTLKHAGADAIKVGIGPGSVCTTRTVTGVGVPQLTAIMDCADVKGDTILIADGGIKNSGDIVKALAAGADFVMLGSLLAGTDEAPGDSAYDPVTKKHYKPYRGQSIFGSNAAEYTPEGVSGWVELKGPVADVLHGLTAGIRSGMSYVGANNLAELRENAEFIRVSASTHLETRTRVTTEIF